MYILNYLMCECVCVYSTHTHTHTHMFVIYIYKVMAKNIGSGTLSVNMIKEGCENQSTLLILLISYYKHLKSYIILQIYIYLFVCKNYLS